MRDFIAKKVQAVPPSGLRRFFDIAGSMDNVISLGIGEPDFCTPPGILRAGIASLESGETHYTSNLGMRELREALAEHLERLYGVRYDPETELLITVGVSEALYLALVATVDPGDEVVVPEPCFVAYNPEVMLAGGAPVRVPTYAAYDFQLLASDLEKAITSRTKTLLLGYPSNPTGAVAERETLQRVAEIAIEHNLLIVSDEIYDRLVYNFKHVCVSSLGEEIKKRTVLLSGLSKAYAMTGWRIGYACGPAEIIKGLVRIHQYTIMSAPTTAQDAALEALKNGEPYVQEMLGEYDRRRRLIVEGLNSLGLTTFEPRGAFYAFPRITASGMDDETFAERLLQEEHVAVVPGNAFGLGGDGYVRCSYATAYEKIEEALRRMEAFMTRHG